MTCDGYQIAFDQLAARAPASVSRAEVDAHAAGCAACTAYVSLSRKVTDSMMDTLSVAPPALDLDAMRALVTKFQRQLIRGRVVVPLAYSAAMLAMDRLLEPVSWRHTIVSAVIGGLMFYILWGWMTRRKLRDLTALDATADEGLVAGLRSELDRRIRNERQGWWVLPLVLAAFHWQFVGAALPTGAILVFELCYLALLPLGVVRYRRARRERALLG